MNFLILRTLGLYLVYLQSLIKGDKKNLKEIWSKREEYNLALYGALFWIFILFVSGCIIAYCIKYNITI